MSFISCDDFIQTIAAGEIVAVEAVSGEDSAGDVAAQAAVAVHIDFFAAIQPVQMFSQFVQRNVNRGLRDLAGGEEFLLRTHFE